VNLYWGGLSKVLRCAYSFPASSEGEKKHGISEHFPKVCCSFIDKLHYVLYNVQIIQVTSYTGYWYLKAEISFNCI